MIPTWLKILWNLFGLIVYLYILYPLSGLIVMGLTEASGEKFHSEDEVIKDCFIFIVLFLIWILSFVLIMIVYQIPFNKWIG